MWALLEKLVSKSKSLNSSLGEVVYITKREHGVLSHSFFEWRVKSTFDGSQIYVGVAMRPDAYAGAEGSPTNYMNFDLDTAVRLRDSLNECIEFARRKKGAVSSRSRIPNS